MIPPRMPQQPRVPQHHQPPMMRQQPPISQPPHIPRPVAPIKSVPKTPLIPASVPTAPSASSVNKIPVVSNKRGVKRKLEEEALDIKDKKPVDLTVEKEKVVKKEVIQDKKTEISNSIQSFIKKLKIKKPKVMSSAEHYKALFEKRKKLKNAVITKAPFQSEKRRTVVLSNIAPFPSILEIVKFIRDNLKLMGLHEGAQVEKILVPQEVDFYGTPKHTGFAQVVVKDVKFVPRVLEAFSKKVFCQRLINAAQG